MKMSRARFNELSAENKLGPSLFYVGPKETGIRWCQIGAPKTFPECGYHEDTSEVVYDKIDVEPDWRIEPNDWGGWDVFKGDHVYARLSGTTWKTKDRAEEFLALAVEDFWDE